MSKTAAIIMLAAGAAIAGFMILSSVYAATPI